MVIETLYAVVEALEGVSEDLQGMMDELDSTEEDAFNADVALLYQRVLDCAGMAKDLTYEVN